MQLNCNRGVIALTAATAVESQMSHLESVICTRVPVTGFFEDLVWAVGHGAVHA